MMSLKSRFLALLSPAKGLRPRIFLAVFLLLAGFSTYQIARNADKLVSQADSNILTSNILSPEAHKAADDLGIATENGAIIRRSSKGATTNSDGVTASSDSTSDSDTAPEDAKPTSDDSETPTFVAFYADNQSDSDADDIRHQNVVNRILATSANPVIHAGDIMEDGTLDSWNRFLNIASPLLSARTFYAALGNNDRVVGDSGTPSSYFLDYFNFPNNERWYSVNSGNMHLVILDSAFDWDSADQLSWLESDLQSEASQSRITVVVYHHPTFTSVVDTRLINYGVDFVICGHIHAYSKNISNGIYFFTLPGGTSIGHATASIYSDHVIFKAYDQNGSLIESTQFNER